MVNGQHHVSSVVNKVVCSMFIMIPIFLELNSTPKNKEERERERTTSSRNGRHRPNGIYFFVHFSVKIKIENHTVSIRLCVFVCIPKCVDIAWT